MDIREFGVERWMDAYEDHCEYNLAETCVDSLYMHELLAMTGTSATFLDDLRALKLTYGAIEGSSALRDQIASLLRRRRARM